MISLLILLNMSIFKKGITICYVVQEEDEPYDHFLDRGNFIVSQEPKNDQEYNKAVIYSRFYINNKILKCAYDSEIMKELETMKQKCTS